VPLGIYGSTLNDELNRLANGGTYPAISAYKDQAGAAQAWAAARSVSLNDVTDLVGVLNYINGVTNRSQMLDVAGVCNSLAGTTQLEPAAALRQVAS
jgi:CelD/BcsL family acetyltransferase involved in cellulose biosynthesis